jgi:hypothetical protein
MPLPVRGRDGGGVVDHGDGINNTGILAANEDGGSVSDPVQRPTVAA